MARAFAPYDPRGARSRLFWSAFLGVATWWAAPIGLGVATRTVAAWDASALALLVLVGVVMLRSDAEETRRRAAANDPGRTAVWFVVLAACTFSLFAAAVVLRRAKSAPSPTESDALSALCLTAVVVSWLLAHAAFTLRYAHLYYRTEPEPEGGIEFPGGEKPDDFDFAYFAFTIGMCFQVSDTTITSRAIRRTTLAHGLLSFAYNTVVLALALNLVFGQLG